MCEPLLDFEYADIGDDDDDDALIPKKTDNRRFKPAFWTKRNLCLSIMAVVGAVLVTVILVVFVRSSSESSSDPYELEKDPAYWMKVAQDELQTSLNEQNIRGVAKNTIIFLGDGMGMTSVTAARILSGQLKGKKGEETMLSFDHFPHTGLSKTYNVDHQTTDSAASATAYLCGVKTNQRLLGVSAKAVEGDCQSSQDAHVDSILQWAHQAGKSTGIVTTTRITHASPAATYSHTPNRDWETDSLIPEDQRQCEDIAKQLVFRNKHINVALGGGRRMFYPVNFSDPDGKTDLGEDENMTRTDNLNLIEEWLTDKRQTNVKHSYVINKDGLDSVDIQETDFLLGLFNQDHMQYEIDRNKTKEPSLAEMTEKAVQILKKNENGFFLFVEGGRIDTAHHDSQPARALHDLIAFANAVEVAVRLTEKSETLIVVTADHSHTMSVAGYATRGHPILGVSDENSHMNTERVTDGKPYSTLLYANGPGYAYPRPNITDIDTANKSYVSQSGVPMTSETHGGEDVTIYARGPQSFLYSGVHEQNFIPLAMAYAACIGPYAEGKLPCARNEQASSPAHCVPKPTSSGASLPCHKNVFMVLLVLMLLMHNQYGFRLYGVQ